PSPPAERAPLLPRTRRHPTSRNAGSQTRLNRSPNRRVRSWVAHRCSLAWIPRTRASASSMESVGHGAPVFTGALPAFQPPHCGLAAALRHARGSPALGLLRRLRPLPRPTADGEPARHRAGRPAGGGTPEAVPRSPGAGWRGRCPAFPRQPRHTYAADLQRGLLAGPPHRRRSRIAQPSGVRALLPGPYPPGWSRFWTYGGLTTGSALLTPSRLACRTRAVWQYRPVPSLSGLLPPSPAPPRSGCPQLQRPAATGRRRSPFTSARTHGASWRTGAFQYWPVASITTTVTPSSPSRSASTSSDRVIVA